MNLFACSQGRIRWRTAEVPAVRGGLDARSCGTDIDAVVPITDLIRLADVIVRKEERHAVTECEFMHADGRSTVDRAIGRTPCERRLLHVQDRTHSS